MTTCAGRCGREASGHFNSGRPELDRQHMWCDRCQADLAAKRMPPGLVTYAPHVPPPLPTAGRELSSADRAGIQNKILAGERKATITAPPLTDTGTFTGYLAAFGRDHGGDTIMGPAAVADTVEAVNSGAIAWHLTDSHSEKASDVVATVTAAAVDRNGLRIEAAWMPTERAQALRQMVKNGARLGLSIDYLADAARPDGRGGRYLDRITVVGGAITPRPMNAAAVITEGKAGPWVPVVDVYADAQRQAERNDPERKAEDRILAAASWPPPGLFDRETSLELIRGAALAKSRRDLEGDPHAREVQARRDRDNRYSSDLTEWMAANR